MFVYIVVWKRLVTGVLDLDGGFVTEVRIRLNRVESVIMCVEPRYCVNNSFLFLYISGKCACAD